MTSNFVKFWLPSDAEEITPETVPAQITQVPGKVVADAGRGNSSGMRRGIDDDAAGTTVVGFHPVAGGGLLWART